MPNIRYRFTGDEDQLPVAPPSPLEIGDDSDAWWAGVHLSAVAVPLAGGVVALALSASLAWGLQQQTEDTLPPPPAAVVGEAEAWPALAPPLPAITAYLPPEDEPPAGMLVGQADEDLWAVWTPRPPAPAFLYLPEPEGIPAGALFGVPEESPWAVPAPNPARPVTDLPVGDDEFPVAAAPEFGGEEAPWTVWTPVAARPATLPALPVPDDEVAFAAPAAPAEEEPWRVWTPPGHPIVVYVPDDEAAAPASPPTFTPEDDAWLAWIFQPAPSARPVFWLLRADEPLVEIIPPPEGSGLEFAVPGGRRDFAAAGGRREFAAWGSRRSFTAP